MQVLIIVKKDNLNQIFIKNQTDLIYYSYYLYFNIKEFDPQSGKNLRKTKIVILYNNKVG